jgi:hypothetical protein
MIKWSSETTKKNEAESKSLMSRKIKLFIYEKNTCVIDCFNVQP